LERGVVVGRLKKTQIEQKSWTAKYGFSSEEKKIGIKIRQRRGELRTTFPLKVKREGFREWWKDWGGCVFC